MTLGLIAAAALAPELETRARARAASGCVAPSSSRCLAILDVDLDAAGVLGSGAHVRRGPLRATTGPLRVGLGPEGLRVFALGLDGQLEPAPPRAGPTPEPAPTSDTPGSATRPWLAPLRARAEAALEQVPVRLQTSGVVRVAVAGATAGPTLALSVHDPSLARTGELLRVEGSVRAQLDGLPDVRATELIATASGADPHTWEVAGKLALGEGRPLHVRGTVTDERLELRVAEGGAVAGIAVTGWRQAASRPALSARAEAFPLAALQPLLRELAAGPDLDLQGVRLDGALTVEPTGADAWELAFADVRVRDLLIHDERLARDAVQLDELAIDGRVRFDPRRHALAGHATLTHGPLHVALTGAADPERVGVQLALAPLPCQDLVDGLPDAFVGALQGMKLAGEFEASAALAFRPEHVRTHGADAAARAANPVDASLETSVPFFERCHVLADGPRVDLPALTGAYRHRFLTDAGLERERMLAPGSPDFVELSRVPLIARAFITLEDGRFYHHDGFDPEQIERALWHNLGAAKFGRGASTITQQTARNLWLGIDRSLARKLQEAVLARRLEDSLDKGRILELYVNLIELGPETFGVVEAARYHFGREPDELNALQAVHLAAMAPAPRAYSRRFAHGQVDAAWLAKLHEQLRRMNLHGWITREQLAEGLRAELALVDHTAAPS